MTSFVRERFYPSYLILVTISISLLVSSSSASNEKIGNVITLAALEDNKSFPLPPLSSATLFEKDGEGSSNVPIRMCDSSQQQRKYADLTKVYLSPPCEQAYQGFCGIRRNQNYSLITTFLSKVRTKSLSVQVNSIDPTFGWETKIWPEFNVCTAQFNITCPHNPNNLVQAFLHESVPEGVLALRALVRIRLYGIDENDIKRVYICRQLNLQVY